MGVALSKKQRNRSRNGHDDRRVASFFRSLNVRTPKVRREDRRQLSLHLLELRVPAELVVARRAGHRGATVALGELQGAPGTGHHVLDFGRARLVLLAAEAEVEVHDVAAEAVHPPAAGREAARKLAQVRRMERGQALSLCLFWFRRYNEKKKTVVVMVALVYEQKGK